jgi:hypothetical protein
LKARTGDGACSSRYALFFLALAALAAAAFIAAPSSAQEIIEERPGLLNRLFGSKPAYRIEPEAIEPRSEVTRPRSEVRRPRAEVAKPKPKARKKRPRAREGVEPPPVTVVGKRPDARMVLVVGDFLGSGLAEGLTTAFTQNANIKIVDRTSGSSGFVREDFLNWPEKVGELITKERPAAIVVMIGANDRQQMLVDGTRETVRSENWNKEYAERAGELAKAIAARKVPFLWVGMPSFKASKTMLDMLAFNDIYRAAATSTGGEFVDIWDGFVDENGAYMPTGPDINGQPARLRANDGINLARPGKRKVAFYVEKPLYRLLGLDPGAPGAATALSTRPAYRIMGPFGPTEPQEPSDIDVLIDPNETGPLDPARPVALRTPALDGGVELLGEVAEPRREARTPAEKLAIDGIAPAPVDGRADQFAAPQLASAATAMSAMNINRTLNKSVAPSVLPDPVGDRAALRRVRADVLTRPQPKAPPQAPPAIRPDRLEEISPTKPAPAVAALDPPMVTPATVGKAIAPDAPGSDARDLAPSRGAPLQSYKRPKSIGPGPNRAPTAVPKPTEEIFTPAEVLEEIPSASNADGASEASAEAKPATPDTAPSRAGAPSVAQEPADDLAPARGAPGKANPAPMAALPAAKDAPTELQPAPEAPDIVVPNAPVEPAADVSVAKAVPSSADPVKGDAPVKAVPSSGAPAPMRPPVLTAPTALPAAPAAPAQTERPATPAAPAAPTELPNAPPAKAEVAPGAAGSTPPRPAQPSSSTPG